MGSFENLLPSLAEIVQEAALTKRSFVQTSKVLRFSWIDEETRARILDFMHHVTIIVLEERAELFRQHQEDREKFLALTDEEFGSLLESTSQKKLCKVVVDNSTLRFSARELLPITHFKKLSRLGNWNTKEECFKYSLPMISTVRDNLFDAVSALSRSKKQVTKNDIAERRKLRVAWEKAKQSELNIEDMDYGDYSGNFGTHAAMIREAEGGFKKFERTLEGARDDVF